MSINDRGAAVQMTPTDQVTFLDRFEGPNGTPLGQHAVRHSPHGLAWQDVQHFVVQNGHAEATADGALAWLHRPNAVPYDIVQWTLSVDITTSADAASKENGLWLYYCAVTNNGCFKFDPVSGKLLFCVYIAGTPYELALSPAGSIAPSTPYSFRFEYRGNGRFTPYLNGAKIGGMQLYMGCPYQMQGLIGNAHPDGSTRFANFQIVQGQPNR